MVHLSLERDSLACMAICVVLDTNQWDRMPVMRHELAASLLFAIRSQEGAFIALPEVVRAEVRKHLVDKCRTAQDRLKGASGELRQIFGKAQEVEHHRDEEVDEALDERIIELESALRVVEHSDADLLGAARMVITYSPPNQTSQQYRDSVIWQTVLRLAEEHEVFLVTNDGDFYASKSDNQLHPILADEVSALKGRVTLFRDVESLLTYLGNEKPVPEELINEIKDNIAEAVAVTINDTVCDKGFAVRNCMDNNTTFYLTENPDRLAVSSDLQYELVDPEYPEHLEPLAIAAVSATAAVDMDELDVDDVALDKLHIDALTPHGESKIAHIQYVQGSGHIGIGTYFQPYRLRKKLEVDPRRSE